MKEYESRLIQLGFSKNEARTYLALLGYGNATANTLIKEMKVHRNIVYDNLNKLIEKGIVSYTQENKIKQFYAHPPETLVEMMEENKKNLLNQIEKMQELTNELKTYKLTPTIHETHIFRGISGIKKVLSLFLAKKNSIQKAMGITNASTELLGMTFWNNYNQKVIANKIKEKLLVNQEYEEKTIMTSSPNTTIQRLPLELSQKVQAIIHEDMVALFVYENDPTAVLIKDKAISKMFEIQFDFLWKQSKKTKETSSKN